MCIPALHEQLEVLGLSETESRLYLAGLRGDANVNILAERAQVKRTTAYSALEHMEVLGIARSYKEGRTTMFHVEQPDRLNDLLKKQRTELIQRESLLQTLIPELRTFVLGSSEALNVQLLKDQEQIHRLMFNRFMDATNLYILGSDDILSTYVEQLLFLQRFLIQRTQQQHETTIMTDATDVSANLPSALHIQHVAASLPFESILVFSDDQFLQIHVNSTLTGLHIENNDFMDLLTFFVSLLGKRGVEPVQQTLLT